MLCIKSYNKDDEINALIGYPVHYGEMKRISAGVLSAYWAMYADNKFLPNIY